MAVMVNKKIIVGNWKMNPLSSREAVAIVRRVKKEALKYSNVKTVLCPPVVFLNEIKKVLGATERIGLGAQDCHYEREGAHTGSVSPYMIRNIGAQYVILGHSEKRAAGDTNEIVNLKIKLALKAGLKVILCVGEKERDEYGGYLDVIGRQLMESLVGLSRSQYNNILIAYEPIWAIGTNATHADSPEGFEHSALFIRKTISNVIGNKAALKVPVLYGGSVTPANAANFLGNGGADGLLVGRVSIEPSKFGEILKIANSII
jgi:triosephosphate isomerase